MEKKYCVCDNDGIVYGHDLSFSKAENVLSAQSPEDIKTKGIEIIAQGIW